MAQTLFFYYKVLNITLKANYKAIISAILNIIYVHVFAKYIVKELPPTYNRDKEER